MCFSPHIQLNQIDSRVKQQEVTHGVTGKFDKEEGHMALARCHEICFYLQVKMDFKCHTNLHLVLRFWNQVFTCASVIFRLLARAARSALARYFCRWKRFSSSQIWTLEKEVRGFFLLGGVRFWYGCPIRRVTANGTRAAAGKRAQKHR